MKRSINENSCILLVGYIVAGLKILKKGSRKYFVEISSDLHCTFIEH